MSRRKQRISQLVRAEVARILREEAADPALGLVTLTRVDVAPDLSNALVYWSTPSDDDGEIDRMGEGLLRAAGFVRRRLAEALQLRRTPALLFRHDPSLRLGTETLSTLRDLEHGETNEP